MCLLLLLQALRTVYGADIPEPDAVHVTRWGSDPYSRGSYSYVAVGSTGKDYDTLALPVARCLLFAGKQRKGERAGGGGVLQEKRVAEGGTAEERGGILQLLATHHP